MISDIITALIQYFKTFDSITDLVSDRIYGGEFPACEIGNMPRKVLIMRYSGGLLTFRPNPLQRQRLDVFSYGETYLESRKVDYAMIEALHNLSRKDFASTFLQSAGYGGAIQLKEQKTGWNYMLRVVIIIADERLT